MPRRNSSPYFVRRRDQMEALTSPARQELLDALEASGPCSISDLATLLGRAADSLYYHVRKLEKLGLVVPHGKVKAGRRDAAVYDVPGRPMRIDQEAIDRRTRPIMLRSGAAMMRSAQRDLGEALESGEPFGHGKRRRVWVGRTKGWFTSKELAEVNGHLRALMELFTNTERRKGSRLHTFTYLLTPVAPRERSADSDPSRGTGQ